MPRVGAVSADSEVVDVILMGVLARTWVMFALCCLMERSSEPEATNGTFDHHFYLNRSVDTPEQFPGVLSSPTMLGLYRCQTRRSFQFASPRGE
jgi:hypothetical protein